MLPFFILIMQPLIVSPVSVIEHDTNGITQKSAKIITGVKNIPCETMKKCTGDLFLDQKDVDIDARRRQKILSKAKRLYDISIRSILRHISMKKNSGYKNDTLPEDQIKSFHSNRKVKSHQMFTKPNSIHHFLNDTEEETIAVPDAKEDLSGTLSKMINGDKSEHHFHHHRRHHKHMKGQKKHNQHGMFQKKGRCCLIHHKRRAHLKKIKKNMLWDRRIPRI